MSLYNHTNSLRADFVPHGPSFKNLRTDVGRLPGGVPGLRADVMNAPAGVNMTSGDRTNGRVQNTILTRSRDQNRINRYQFAWADTQHDNRVALLSLQQLNEMLATEVSVRTMGLGALLDRFRLMGVLTNNDADTSDDIPMERGPRVVTCTSWGSALCFDYWSTYTESLQPYDNCFFVLRRVQIASSHRFQTDLNIAVHNSGRLLAPDVLGSWVWQVVPVCGKSRAPPQSALVTDENGRAAYGAYWSVGHAHEYAQLPPPERYAARSTLLDVARDVSFLHLNARARPIQFHCKISPPRLVCSVDQRAQRRTVPSKPPAAAGQQAPAANIPAWMGSLKQVP